MITVFLLGSCTCDNLGKKAKVIQDQKEDTPKQNSELIESEHAENLGATLKENSNSDSQKSPPLTPPKGGRTGQPLTPPGGKGDGKVSPFGGDLEGAGRGAAVDSLSVEIQTFQTEKGWSYDVFVDGKKYIHQEIIPAVSGTNGFDTEENAKKVAGLVSHKIRNNIMPPSVTPEELDSLGIK